MEMITSASQMQSTCKQLTRSGKTIGFVPTMGYLHEGHLALMTKARKENDIVVISVFVNPLQFGPHEDLDQYPRDVEQDMELAKQVGVDYFFYPTVDEMYPKALTTKLTAITRVNALCGKKREGHFDGVVIVLMKLFNIVFPDRVYMGLKDAQQVAVVQGLVDDYQLPTRIIPIATVREGDGLAKSSRNVYLTDEERKLAPILYESLKKAERLIHLGERSADQVVACVKDELIKTNAVIDYVDIYAYPTFERIEKLAGQLVLAVAVKFSQARLIDNVIIKVDEV
ncbi:MAG: pantoate--beta-alanine ligase [Defluviitaleaceae bacterium]|nr:pantoate--beta-alanine ligase [Defluviitaleaceae bacterium]